METYRRVAAAAGVAGPAVALGSILVATFVSPTFTWADAALSDMGRPGEPTYWLFNGGLVVAGAVSLPFTYALVDAARNAVHRAGAAAFALAVVAMALVGVLHLPRAGHGAAAVAHYLLATVVLWVWGSGDALAGRVRRGLATVWLGIAHVLAWLAWAALLAPAWFAVAEYAGAVLFGGWTVWTASRLFTGRPSRTP